MNRFKEKMKEFKQIPQKEQSEIIMREKELCICPECPTCPISEQYGLTHTAFCIRGAETNQRYFDPL